MLPGRSESRGIYLFIVLALGMSLAYWGAAQALGAAFDRDLWGAVRGFIPAIAALVTVLIEGGPGIWGRLGFRAARPGGRPSLYLLALAGSALAVVLALIGASLLGTPDWTMGPVTPARFLLFFFAMAVIDGPLGEEIGWRGFLEPRLLRQLSPLATSLVIGVVWWAWHLPLYAADGRALTPGFLAGYLVQLIAVATIYTWFFLRSDGSLLLAIVLHDASNYFQFLAVKLVPVMAARDAMDLCYVIVVIGFGLVAGWSLRSAGQSNSVSSGR